MKLQQPPGNVDGKVLTPTAIALIDEEVIRPSPGSGDAPFAHRERGAFRIRAVGHRPCEFAQEPER